MDGAIVAAASTSALWRAPAGDSLHRSVPRAALDEGYRAAFFSSGGPSHRDDRRDIRRPARCLANGFTGWAASEKLPPTLGISKYIRRRKGPQYSRQSRWRYSLRAQWAGQGSAAGTVTAGSRTGAGVGSRNGHNISPLRV